MADIISDAAKVKDNWFERLADREWARGVRVRIHLRRKLKREPTEREFKAVMAKKQKDLGVTGADVSKAFSTGEEVSIVRHHCAILLLIDDPCRLWEYGV